MRLKANCSRRIVCLHGDVVLCISTERAAARVRRKPMLSLIAYQRQHHRLRRRFESSLRRRVLRSPL